MDVGQGLLVTGSADATIKVWEAESRRCTAQMADHEDWVRAARGLRTHDLLCARPSSTCEAVLPVLLAWRKSGKRCYVHAISCNLRLRWHAE